MTAYKLTEDQKRILDYIKEMKKYKTGNEICKELNITSKVLRHTLTKLKKLGIIIAKPRLLDMRTYVYKVTDKAIGMEN